MATSTMFFSHLTCFLNQEHNKTEDIISQKDAFLCAHKKVLKSSATHLVAEMNDRKSQGIPKG